MRSTFPLENGHKHYSVFHVLALLVLASGTIYAITKGNAAAAFGCVATSLVVMLDAES